jgi:hypothetical protein
MTRIEAAISKRIKELLSGSTLSELQAKYILLFKVATKSKDRKALAKKIAKVEVERIAEEQGITDGSEPSSKPQVKSTPAQSPATATGAPTPTAAPATGVSIDPAIAKATLEKVKDAWDETEALREEKKTKAAEFRKQIKKIRDQIKTVLADGSISADQKVLSLEDLWKGLTQTESKKDEVAADYNQRIKDATTTMKKSFDDIRQLTLF